METVSITFKYTQAEYVKAERQYLLASKTITKMNVVVLAIYLPFSLLYLFFSSFSVLSIVAAGVAIFALIAGCALYFYIPAYKFRATAKYQETYHLAFSKDGIEFKTTTIHSELKWDVYSELWESNDFYFLIHAPRRPTLISRRSSTPPSSKQAFR